MLLLVVSRALNSLIDMEVQVMGPRIILLLHDFGLVLLRIYVALAVFQPYRDLEARDNQSLKFKWRGGESNPGPLAPQAKSLTTRPPPLPTPP